MTNMIQLEFDFSVSLGSDLKSRVRSSQSLIDQRKDEFSLANSRLQSLSDICDSISDPSESNRFYYEVIVPARREYNFAHMRLNDAYTQSSLALSDWLKGAA
jgi:hypothetical protein